MHGLPLLVGFPEKTDSLKFIAKELSWSAEDLACGEELFKRGLPLLADSKTLPYLFGVSPKLISAMGKFPHRYYRTFTVSKKAGGVRKIEAPRRFLKVVQRWIHDHILLSRTFPPYVIGFVRGRNIFDNGRPHAGSRNLMVVDIQDFFPSIGAEKISKVFLEFGYPPQIAWQLTSLCSLEGRLPQGAPTSPTIANIVFLPVDKELERLAQQWRCKYTRYADDLAFSGSRSFGIEDIATVEAMIVNYGFSLNQSKSRIIGSGGRQIVAGLVVNRVAQPPRFKRRIWRATFHRASKHPREFLNRVGTLRGIAGLVNQYNPALAENYGAVVRKITSSG